MTNIHQKIAAIRHVHNYSQQEAARRAYISFRTYQRIESGECSPRLDDIERLAQAFGCAVVDILFFDLEHNSFPMKTEKEQRLEYYCEYLKAKIRSFHRRRIKRPLLFPIYLDVEKYKSL